MHIFVEMKHCFLWLLLCYVINGSAQYTEFPKLESLYNASKYDKCIEKASEEVVANSK